MVEYLMSHFQKEIQVVKYLNYYSYVKSLLDKELMEVSIRLMQKQFIFDKTLDKLQVLKDEFHLRLEETKNDHK